MTKFPRFSLPPSLQRRYLSSYDAIRDLLEKRFRSFNRYESTDPDDLDGALFAFVTSTDPEALLVIEARTPTPADGPVWEDAICRMTDLELRVRHKGKEAFAAPLIPYGSPVQDSQQRFRAYHDREIPPIEAPKAP